ncbi:MAG: type IX secretion system protein PorQ [Flavobacteriales bacterium]|nr:type IX secretion system protein PorQ [Flavobacteriales bacterium]
MKKLVAIFLLLSSFVCTAQIGGTNTYEFLNIPISARVASLGGNAIAVYDNDPTLAFANPSLLNAKMNGMVTFSYLNYFADINHGFVSYVKDLKKAGTFSAGIRYLDYGTFLETDEGGNELGNFTAAEYAFILGWGKQIDSLFSVGANLKPIYSNLYLYSSAGIAFDFSATYHNEDIGLVMSLLFKNVEVQLSPYVEGGRKEPLPFEVQFGLSYKLGHAPIRLFSDMTQLQNWNLAYNDSIVATNSNEALTDEEKSELNKTSFLSEYMAHGVVGLEFVPSKSFMLRLGYSPRRRSELAHDNKPGLVGFSWGLGFRIKKFHISYGSAKYHLAGPSNHFTVTTNLSEYYRKGAAPRPPKEKKVKKVKTKKPKKDKKKKDE